MSEPKPMPRRAVIAAASVIFVAAVAGLAMGIARNFHVRGGIDTDTGEVVAPIKSVPNATALVAPPVTEADVRRWAREEMLAQHAAAPKKPKVEDGMDADPDAEPTTLPSAAAPGAATPPPTVTPPKPATAQQIPF